MTTIAANLQAVRRRIELAAAACGRRPAEISLIAVSKTFPATYIGSAHAEGQRAFGENYAQEAVDKITELRGLDIEWHFIGPIQSNKTRAVAEHFAWVHSVARSKIAERLNDARPAAAAPLNVCIQVNVSGEAAKSGVMPAEVFALASTVARLPRLVLRGLMAIPEPTADTALLRSRYAQLRILREHLNAEGFALDTLSMGMSEDLEAAILEGATIVRVGTASCGVRKP
jgi:pyridoxal phosphate enzyme (YggS family)